MPTRLWGAAVLAALLAGCSSSAGELDVTGDVTFNGAPVGGKNDALIRFEPADGAGTPRDVAVEDGKYAIKLPPGSYKVKITWSKGTGRKARPGAVGPGSDIEETRQVIPAKYNDQTTLTAEVAPGKTKHDFALTK